MKKSPQERKLERLLRSSKFSASGFIGNDRRNLWEIIDEDASEITRAGKTMEGIAQRMRQITDTAKKGLGDWVEVSKTIKASVDDNRGMIPCPWPHHIRCLKRITTVQHIPTETIIRWSELNIHLIEEHGFFEGRGSAFRIEPRILIDILFPDE
jgi:hypothetical protein